MLQPAERNGGRSASNRRSAGDAPGNALADSLLSALDSAQRRAVVSNAKTICILAGPGSGKTRVLTHRIAYKAAIGECDPRFAVALTFTRRAATELENRLSTLGLRDKPKVGTFHALAARMIQRWAADAGYRKPSIIAGRTSLLAKVLHPGEQAAAVMGELDWAAARNLAPAYYPPVAAASRRCPPLSLERIAEIMHNYQEIKTWRKVCDFNDLLRLAAERLENDKMVAEAYHWGHRYFFVDEFQDLTPAQFRLLRAQLGPSEYLSAVGDPDQAIYGWNGADSRLLLGFLTNFPRGEVHRLRTNYRSSIGIVAAAQRIRPSGEASAVAPQNLGSAPEDSLKIVRCPDAVAEQQAVAEDILNEYRRSPRALWSNQVVLARTAAAVKQMAQALRKAGIEVLAITSEERFTGEQVAVAKSDAVCVCTIHAAKGREWSVVHLVGLEEGLIPHGLSQQGEALKEERQLLYVALTRACRKLNLYWAATRRGAFPATRKPSRWLAEIETLAGRNNVEFPPGAVLPGAQAHKLVARNGNPNAWNLEERLASPLLKDLREWRRSQGRLSRINPEAVISTNDMNAVDKNRPMTLAELEMITTMGSGRVENFGQQILNLVAKHN